MQPRTTDQNGTGHQFSPSLSEWFEYEFPTKEEEGSIIDQLDRRAITLRGFAEDYGILESVLSTMLEQSTTDLDKEILESALNGIRKSKTAIESAVESAEETKSAYEIKPEAPVWQFQSDFRYRINEGARFGLDYGDVFNTEGLTAPEETKDALGYTPVPLIGGNEQYLVLLP